MVDLHDLVTEEQVKVMIAENGVREVYEEVGVLAERLKVYNGTTLETINGVDDAIECLQLAKAKLA